MSDPTVNAIKTNARPRMGVKTMTSLAMLTAIAYVIMYFSKMLPQVLGFLQLDLKDTVICIGGFVFGPVAAAAVSIIVPLLAMFFASATGPIGLIMNILSSCCFACVAAFLYKRNHTLKGAITGLVVGCLSATAVMLLWNFLITPIYMGVPRETVAAMLVPVFLPFNPVKGGMNLAATLLLYKPVVTALRRAKLIPESEHAAPPVAGKKRLCMTLVFLFVLATLVLCALALAEVI